MIGRLRSALRDPFASSVLVLVSLVIAGLAMLFLGWQGAAAQVRVSDQLPYLVSGGFGGLGLIVFAVGIGNVQSRRRIEARRRAELARVVMAATGLLAQARSHQGEEPS
ncbi:MAG TPA: hypothetical protein VGA69_07985 [Nitriliruptorales bacterium]